MPRVNIRCCCNVNLLLGTVEVSEEVRVGQRYTFPLRDGSRLTLEAAKAGTCVQMSPEMVAQAKFTGQELFEQTEIALKSADTPLERLRLIPSFIEINEECKLA